MQMKKFIIVAKKEAGVFGLYDTENKGVALATTYTIKQLMDMGHEVCGVISSSPFKCQIMTKTGEPAKKEASLMNVPDTKKSAVSFVKGIKPSREEKTANKEKTKKRVATLKATKQEVKKAQKAFEKKLEQFKPSKLLILETGCNIRSSEYDIESQKTTYRFLIKSPSAMTTFRNIIKNIFPERLVKDELNDIMKTFKRHSSVSVEMEHNGILDLWGMDKKVQKGYNNEYLLEFANLYEDFSGEVTLQRKGRYYVKNQEDCEYSIARSNFRYCTAKEATIGATAEGTELIDWIKSLGHHRIIVDQRNEPINITNCDHYIGGMNWLY